MSVMSTHPMHPYHLYIYMYLSIYITGGAQGARLRRIRVRCLGEVGHENHAQVRGVRLEKRGQVFIGGRADHRGALDVSFRGGRVHGDLLLQEPTQAQLVAIDEHPGGPRTPLAQPHTELCARLIQP